MSVFSQGFTLVELAVVLAILALLIGFFMAVTPAFLNAQKAKTTESKIATLEAVLIRYVMQNKRLPCPADGRIASGDANAGVEIARDANGDCTSQTHGVLPWVALGLTSTDAEDGWATRFTYRVAQGLTRNNSMDMSGCDPAGSAVADGTPPNQTCKAGCTVSSLVTSCTSPTNFLAGKGLTIRNQVAGTVLMDPAGNPSNGAAFVLISHGENLSGSYSSTGNLNGPSIAQEGTNEAPNRADQALAAEYIDATKSYADNSSHFDDYVVRPPVMSVIQRALLGPRAYY